MKKLLLGASLITFAGLVFFVASRQIPTETHPSAAVSTPPSETPVSAPLPVTVTPLVDGSHVSLIANYKEKKTGDELMRENSCDYLVNAGFYTKENTPVGYVKIKDLVLRPEKESLLFDGFLTINEMLTARITRTLPKDSLVNALQTGPMLIENGSLLKLRIQNDKEARRMFALVDGNNQILFGMVTSSTLTNLPKVVYDWARQQNIAVADAINLDGGSASTYRGPNGVYPEISPIGSAFCVKN